MAQDVTIEVLEVSVTISPEEQARTFALQAETAKTGAETAESGAVTAKSQSETARDQAVTAKNAAETAETGAETARDKAEEWAESATPPEAGSKSSKTWAGESANSASEAATSAIDAGNEKDAAEGFKNLSQAWAESATAPDGAGTKSSKTYAGLSEAARDASVVAQGQSETAKDAAVVAQGNAETARDEAVTAKNAAELAETGAETAEGNAVTAKNQSETARDLSQAWAESATEPGGVGTKSSKTWAGESAQSATDAEAAKDAVEAITDFTPGNIYQGNGTGIDSLSREDFGKQLELINKSPIRQNFGKTASSLIKLIYHDNFIRPNGAAGVADSGQTYIYLDGAAAGNEISNQCLSNFAGKIIAVPLDATGITNNAIVNLQVANANDGTRKGGIGFFKDSDNYFCIDYNSNEIELRVVIAGVSSVVASATSGLVVENWGGVTNLKITFSRFSTGIGVVSVRDLSFDKYNIFYKFTASDDLSSLSELVTHFGFIGTGASNMIIGFTAVNAVIR